MVRSMLSSTLEDYYSLDLYLSQPDDGRRRQRAMRAMDCPRYTRPILMTRLRRPCTSEVAALETSIVLQCAA